MKVIVKTDTNLTFEHKNADKVSVSSGLHVYEGDRERIYMIPRILWLEVEKGQSPRHKTTKDL